MTSKYLYIFLTLSAFSATLGVMFSLAPALDPTGRASLGMGMMAVEFMVVAMVLMRVERFKTLPSHM